MTFKLLGKKIRGRFGLPSGCVATSVRTAKLLLDTVPQLGFYTGKSTKIDPTPGNREDVVTSYDAALQNAMGLPNPGLEAMIEGFTWLVKEGPSDVFYLPQVAESNTDNICRCIEEYDKLDIDGIEINASCPHAHSGGLALGADPQVLYDVVKAARRATKKPLVVKLNAAVPDIVAVAKAAVDAGADAISAINTLGGPGPQLTNDYGGISGPQIFKVTEKTLRVLREKITVPIIAMGGITEAQDVWTLDEIDPGFFYGIGSALTGLDSEGIKEYFSALEEDIRTGSNTTDSILPENINTRYEPFIIESVNRMTSDLIKIRFYEEMFAGPGQFVFMKIGRGHAKPFSIANDSPLEIVIRAVGKTTTKALDLIPNNVVLIRGPYGKEMEMPHDETVVYVGAGCGIAPLHHAAQQHEGKQTFVLGAKTGAEIPYLDEFHEMGDVFVATEDGNIGYQGTVVEKLDQLVSRGSLDGMHFFNCGPEVVLSKVDAIERRASPAPNILHLIERYTSCGIGICGKCYTDKGYRACVDGPVFQADKLKPTVVKE